MTSCWSTAAPTAGCSSTSSRCQPVNGPDGAPVHYVAVQRDVTPAGRGPADGVALLEAELDETARAVQATLVPAALPELPGWELAAGYSPATRADGGRGAVSGDFYDVFPGAAGGASARAARRRRGSPRSVTCRAAVRGRRRPPAPCGGPCAGPPPPAAHPPRCSRRWPTPSTTPSTTGSPPSRSSRCRRSPRQRRAGTGAARAGRAPAAGAAPGSGTPRLVGVRARWWGRSPTSRSPRWRSPWPRRPAGPVHRRGRGGLRPPRRPAGRGGAAGGLAALPEDRRRGPGAAARTAAAVGAAVAEHVGGGAVDDLTLLVVARA